jgi:hypothetical protein
MQTIHIGRAIGPGLDPGNTHSKQHGGNATGNSNHKGQPPKTNVPKYPQGSQAKTREHTVQKLTQRGHMTATFSFSCQSTTVI